MDIATSNLLGDTEMAYGFSSRVTMAREVDIERSSGDRTWRWRDLSHDALMRSCCVGSYATLLTALSCCDTTVCSPVVRSSLRRMLVYCDRVPTGVFTSGHPSRVLRRKLHCRLVRSTHPAPELGIRISELDSHRPPLAHRRGTHAYPMRILGVE